METIDKSIIAEKVAFKMIVEFKNGIPFYAKQSNIDTYAKNNNTLA
jgi:hypothetical protein